MKVAIIGEGFGRNVVAPIYRQVGFEVTTVSPRDEETVRRLCGSDVDLVSVHSPPFLHQTHVGWALDNRRAVLCEKPFGRDASEAKAMRDRARDADVLTFLNFEFRFQPSRVKLKELLAEGAIGSLQHIHCSFFAAGWRERPYGWLFDEGKAGGWLGAFGSHAVDMICWLYDAEIAECGGTSRIDTTRRRDPNGVEHPVTAEDAFSAWFRLANGGTAVIDTAFSTAANIGNRIVLLGSDGALELVNERTVTLRRPGEAPVEFDFPSPEGADPHDAGLLPWITTIRDSLRDQCQITPSFDEGVRMADALALLRQGLSKAGGR